MHVSQTEQEQLGHDNTVATLQVTKPMNPVRLLAGVEISSKTSPLAGDLGRFRCRKNDQQLTFNSKGNRAAAGSPLLHIGLTVKGKVIPLQARCGPEDG